MHSFLFELGTEEIPDSVIIPAKEALQSSFTRLCQASQIEYSSVSTGCTPRRLYLIASGLPEAQPDTKVFKLGPAVAIAYDQNGQLSNAGNGFLKKSGGTEQDIRIQKTDKGDFLAIEYTQKGKAVIGLLADWIKSAIIQIPLPKKMIWNCQELAFSRPIRWLVALFGDETVPVDFFGLHAGRISFPNRSLGLGSRVSISHPDNYLNELREARVIADWHERRSTIKRQMQELFSDGHYIQEDERLLDTVTNLVEYPTAVVGCFSPEFLKLPEKIITSTISQNQKYFSVYNSDAQLTNKFVFISNGDASSSSIIRQGNEKVVKARLEDAMWFFQEDTKRSLESYTEHLADVVFQSQLGTMADKTNRVEILAAWIADVLKLEHSEKELCLRTARLCKADLVTLMLGEKEFTKLQGYIGMHYALASHEHDLVARGIYEHYMPRGSNDSLPETICGKICAVADKIDTLCGIIGIGMMPTGSGDPFALRRAAGGIVQIIASSNWDLDVYALANRALENFADLIVPNQETTDNVQNFLKQRVVWLLKERNLPQDVISSVMHVDMSHIGVLIARAEALSSYKQQAGFIRLVTGYKRVANIISASKSFSVFNDALMQDSAEEALYRGLIDMRKAIDTALQECDYPQALDHLVELGDPIDRYFDAILVNCEDTAQRENHYALLNLIRQEFLRVADLNLIVMDNETNGA